MRNSNKNKGVIIATAVLSCVSIVGVGYSAFVFGSGLANGTILVGVNAAAVVVNDGMIHVSAAPTVNTPLQLTQYGFVNGNVTSSSTVGTLVIYFNISLSKTASSTDEDGTYDREFDLVLGYEGYDSLDLCQYVSSVSFAEQSGSSISATSITKDEAADAGTYAALVRFKLTISSMTGNLGVKLTFEFTYTGSDFKTDVYDKLSSSNNFTLNYTTS